MSGSGHEQEHDDKKCKDTQKNRASHGFIFTENMLCAGMEGEESCYGDDGSPLFVFYTLKSIVLKGGDCHGNDK